jgi:CRISPR-associated protein Cmr1
MELEINTLTPVWTGGVEAGKVDRLHETGILGSLRWWMEVFARGMGGNVCDLAPPCQYTDKANGGVCDVCRVFGATGWRRRFRIAIRETNISDAAIQHPIKANRTYVDNKGKTRTPTWYFPDPLKSNLKPPPPNTPKTGAFTIEIQSLAQGFQMEVIAGLIQFIADWTAIGARAQMGFGVIEPANGRIETGAFYDWIIAKAGSKSYPTLPSLQNIFLAQIKLKEASPSFTEQTTFNLKYDLRRLFASDQRLRHFIMGTVSGERIAAKVKVSRPYGDSVMRVWGWIPEQAGVYTNSWQRNTVVDAIYQHLQTNYSLQVWREMNSPRDTATPSTSDARVFLHSLLGLKEDGDGA